MPAQHHPLPRRITDLFGPAVEPWAPPTFRPCSPTSSTGSRCTHSFTASTMGTRGMAVTPSSASARVNSSGLGVSGVDALADALEPVAAPALAPPLPSPLLAADARAGLRSRGKRLGSRSYDSDWQPYSAASWCMKPRCPPDMGGRSNTVHVHE